MDIFEADLYDRILPNTTTTYQTILENNANEYVFHNLQNSRTLA